MDEPMLLWKPQWARTRERLEAWWRREGLALSLTSPLEKPLMDLPQPVAPADVRTKWLDPEYRFRSAEYYMAHRYYAAESFPYFDTQLGPGNLAAFLGSVPDYRQGTVWFNPCIAEPGPRPSLRFDQSNPGFRAQMAIVERGVAGAEGRFLVGMPDLIENVDTLVSLRGMEILLADMMDRPEWIEEGVWQVNDAYYDAFDRIRTRIRDPWNGNAFSSFQIWGQGRTAKLQCDSSAAFSPAMFRRFVVPALTAQCRWLDRTLYHLDGTQCFCHLDPILEIEELDAVEWTPQAGRPNGGSPEWFDLYRRILKAGKGVQAVGVKAEEVIPLLDAVGGKGLFIIASARTEEEARRIEEKAEAYR
jgi:hypothetical protein